MKHLLILLLGIFTITNITASSEQTTLTEHSIEQLSETKQNPVSDTIINKLEHIQPNNLLISDSSEIVKRHIPTIQKNYSINPFAVSNSGYTELLIFTKPFEKGWSNTHIKRA